MYPFSTPLKTLENLKVHWKQMGQYVLCLEGKSIYVNSPEKLNCHKIMYKNQKQYEINICCLINYDLPLLSLYISEKSEKIYLL